MVKMPIEEHVRFDRDGSRVDLWEIGGDTIQYAVFKDDVLLIMTELHMLLADDEGVCVFPRRDADSPELRLQPWYKNWVLMRHQWVEEGQ